MIIAMSFHNATAGKSQKPNFQKPNLGFWDLGFWDFDF
jgi:hypothetical protein